MKLEVVLLMQQRFFYHFHLFNYSISTTIGQWSECLASGKINAREIYLSKVH